MNNQAYSRLRCTSALALLSATLGFASAGCTGDDSANHEITQPDIPGPTVLVDNFEMVTAPGAAPSSLSAPFSGGWYKYDDHTLDAPDGGLPDADTNAASRQQVAVETLPEPHQGLAGESKAALHIYGGIYTGWGAGVTGTLAANAPYDGSAFSGILFWAKRGSASTSNAMTIALPTTNDTAMEGGACDDNAPMAQHLRCSDSFHLDLTLRSDWTLYVLYFSDMAQSGWGYKPPGGFNKRGIIGVAFSNKGVSSKGGDPFDEWIDDVAFFK
jgi:hypothetical protein